MINGDLLLKMYASGCFPMWDSDTEEIDLFRPDPRAIIELNAFHVPRRLEDRIRQAPFRVTSDEGFERVFDACHQEREDGTWMHPELKAGYMELFDRGFAHSVEAWNEEELLGGLYGVQIGAAFMAESKFSRPKRGGTDASKICLVETIQRLRDRDFELFDVQFNNPHLEQFGVVEISAEEYERRLSCALQLPRDW